MKESEFYRKFEEIVEADSGSLDGPELLNDLEGWDSLAILSFLAMLDEELEISVSADQIGSCERIKDLLLLCGDRVELEA